MRRIGLALLVLSLAAGGGAAASVVAGTGPPITTLPTLTAPPPPEPQPAPPGARVPDGVTIGGIYVGGLDRDTAAQVVRAGFDAPLVLVVGDRHVRVLPHLLGAHAYVGAALAHAMSAAPGSHVRLVVAVHGAPVRAYVRRLARRFAREPVDATVSLRNLRPVIAPGHTGLRIDRRATVAAIVRALNENRRGPLRIPSRVLQPTRSEQHFGPVIVIHRGSNTLYLFRGTRFWRRFRVATGQAAYPTPLGHFEIVVKWRDPWWYPPPSPWAQGLKPVPPGPGNPLGTRWMGLSAPGVGIHGTPDPASIGYSASHGCIRMFIPDAEWLFQHVEIGTPVFIVAA